MYRDHVECKDTATDDLGLKVDQVSSFNALLYHPLQGVILHKISSGNTL